MNSETLIHHGNSINCTYLSQNKCDLLFPPSFASLRDKFYWVNKKLNSITTSWKKKKVSRQRTVRWITKNVTRLFAKTKDIHTCTLPTLLPVSTPKCIKRFTEQATQKLCSYQFINYISLKIMVQKKNRRGNKKVTLSMWHGCSNIGTLCFSV